MPSELDSLLPEVFQRACGPGSPLAALLEVMAAMHAPSERVLDDLGSYFDPRTAPAPFVLFLTRWVDLDWLPAGSDPDSPNAPGSTPALGRMRELVATAAKLAGLRGTSAGLVLFLETATGEPGFAIDERVLDDDDEVRPFHVCVRAPGAVRDREALVRRIVEVEIPCHLTFDLRFDDD